MKFVHPLPGGGPYGIQVEREVVRRSWLVVSVIDEDAIAKAPSWGADVIVLDLEDNVHDTKKADARARVLDSVSIVAKGGAEVFVRPDIDLIYADLQACIWHGVTGLVLPKVKNAEQVREVERVIGEFEGQRGLPGVIELHLALETGPGNYNAREIIGASPRVRSAGLGRADLVMDLRGEPSGELHIMPYILERMVASCRAEGIEPVGAYWRADARGTVATSEATLKAARDGRALGTTGSFCALGEQVGSLNIGYTPATGEVEHAKAIVSVFDKVRAKGERQGVFDGLPVTSGMARTAARIIEYAELCSARDEAKKVALKG